MHVWFRDCVKKRPSKLGSLVHLLHSDNFVVYISRAQNEIASERAAIPAWQLYGVFGGQNMLIITFNRN